MEKQEIIAAAKLKASQHQLDPALVCAIIEQESNWNTWAIRYEPAFLAKYVSPLYAVGTISATEAWTRSMSWGLMQVMGQVAREQGYRASFLSNLCDPWEGIEVGCQVFAHKLERAGGDVTKALLLWNGGGRPEYAGEVLARMVKYQ